MTAAATQAWNPVLYDDKAAFVSNLASDLVQLLAPKSGERVLDIGCGTGTLSAEIANAGARVTGLDASSAMIDAAREKYPALVWSVGDGERLAYTDEFDAVFSNAALHWMQRADDVARGIARALVPGGRFVAEFGGARCVGTVRAAASEILRAWGEDPGAFIDWYFPTLAEYAGVLERAGLEPREMRWFERPTPLAGEHGLSSWMTLFQAPLLNHLGERQARFLELLADRCRPQLYRDQTWFVDYTRLRVLATKPR